MLNQILLVSKAKDQQIICISKFICPTELVSIQENPYQLLWSRALLAFLLLLSVMFLSWKVKFSFLCFSLFEFEFGFEIEYIVKLLDLFWKRR